MERLRAAGAREDEAKEAAAAIAAALPVDRAVTVDEAILEAARRGDVALVVSLLAEEVEPDEVELAALRELDEHPELRETIPLETARADLGL
jgi:hypothetical protein